MPESMTSKAICILGAHRSGTSTITRGLNLLGAYLGEESDLMKPLPENPEGFWERLDVYYLQNRLLAMLKREWDATAPLPENWHKAAEIRPLKDELAALVKNNFSGQSLWAWKDPRTCLLLPLWRDVLSELGMDLKVIFVVRNPLDVARSLERRNGFTLDKGLGVWFNDTLAALRGVKGLETVFLSYDRFLSDWETELRLSAAGLGIEWPADEAGLKAKMASFVRHDLRHNTSGLDDLHAVNVPHPVIRLYELLLQVQSRAIKLIAAEGRTEAMYQEFLSYARFFDFDLAELADCRSRLAKADESHIMLSTVPLVFIVVLNWNGKDDTFECLRSLQKLDYPNFEIVVVDNGSTDGSEEVIRSSFPAAHFIQTGRNLGYAGGNNVGIKHALSLGADYVWLLNNDTTVDSNALTALVDMAMSDSEIAFVGSKIYLYDRPDVIWYAGGTIDLPDGGRTAHPGGGQKDTGQFDAVSDVGYVTGCSLLVRRGVIATIGLLPEEYFLYFEETDWNLAAQRKGYRTVMAPTSHVWHKHALTGNYSDSFIYYSFRNRIRIVRKYAPQHIFRAFRVNWSLRDEHISHSPERARTLRFITFLAHFDALFHRYGQARWRMIK